MLKQPNSGALSEHRQSPLKGLPGQVGHLSNGCFVLVTIRVRYLRKHGSSGKGGPAPETYSSGICCASSPIPTLSPIVVIQRSHINRVKSPPVPVGEVGAQAECPTFGSLFQFCPGISKALDICFQICEIGTVVIPPCGQG